MNRSTRDKFASHTTSLTSGNACWETPPAIVAKLNRDFGPFDVDLTGDAQRHTAPVWFGPDSPVGEFDALKADWHKHGTKGYSNPPYGPFVQKILQVAVDQQQKGFESVFLPNFASCIRFALLQQAHHLLGKRRTSLEYANGNARPCSL